jgi:hypothetical protein
MKNNNMLMNNFLKECKTLKTVNITERNFFVCLFEISSHCVVQSGLELMFLLPPLSECWNDRDLPVVHICNHSYLGS